ncbi:MAG: hypothetical protein IKL25_04835 [Clostridia bacterium]|nr:hypothetical protein [Clostridia bacterium]
MKKLLSLMLCLTLLCGALPVFAEEADLAALYPTAPITLDEYWGHFEQIMRDVVDPAYDGDLHVVQSRDGRYVMSNGRIAENVHLLELSLEGRYVTGITVSFPFDQDDVQRTADMWTILSIFAAMPFAMHDGLSWDDAYDRCGADFDAHMRSTSANDICPIYGMQAEVSRETGVIRMHYTLHGAIPADAPVETPALGMPGYAAFRAAVDQNLDGLSMPPAWTIPELLPEMDNETYLVAVENLADNPALVYKGDEMLLLMTAYRMEADPHDTFGYAWVVTAEVLFVPLLMAHGMSEEEARGAVYEWGSASGYKAGIVTAMNGGSFTGDFYGLEVVVKQHITSDGGVSINTFVRPNSPEGK